MGCRSWGEGEQSRVADWGSARWDFSRSTGRCGEPGPPLLAPLRRRENSPGEGAGAGSQHKVSTEEGRAGPGSAGTPELPPASAAPPPDAHVHLPSRPAPCAAHRLRTPAPALRPAARFAASAGSTPRAPPPLAPRPGRAARTLPAPRRRLPEGRRARLRAPCARVPEARPRAGCRLLARPAFATRPPFTVWRCQGASWE